MALFAITAFHDPRNADHVLVSHRDAFGRRTLTPMMRATPTYAVKNARTGERTVVSDDASPRCYGQRIGDLLYFPMPPDWRISVSVAFPCVAESWIRCMGIAVWDPSGICCVVDMRDMTAAPHVVRSPANAISVLIDSAPDIVMPLTPHALDCLTRLRLERGLSEFQRLLPVICDPDQFIRGASLDRNTDGSALWYVPPFVFEPPTAHYALSDLSCHRMVNALIDHRRAWIVQRKILDTMFSLAVLTGLPLHEIAEPTATCMADAIIERTWMAHPLEFDAPTRSRENAAEMQKTFKGGGVLDATKGLHCGIIAFPDVRALYPSVVIEYMHDRYPLLAQVFADMIALRSQQHDAVTEGSIKVITNCVFGTRKFGLYACIAQSEEIAQHGRAVQQQSLAAIDGMPGVTLIGGDTDSIALRLEESVVLSDVVARLNSGRSYVKYKAQVEVFSRFFYVNNKSWAGVCARTGATITRGLMQNRATTPRFLLASHREWTQLVLTNQHDEQFRTQWIARRAAQLRASTYAIADVTVWPKPTRQHQDTARAYVVVKFTREHVPYTDYIDSSRTQLPVDIDYLVQIYFEAELQRHSKLLC